MASLIPQDKGQMIFSIIISIAVLALVLMVFWPFLNVIALSIIMAVLLHPVFAFINKKIKSRAVSAGITIFLLVVVIVVPLGFIINNIISEAQNLYATVSNASALSSDQLTGWIEGKVQVYVPNFTVDARGYLAAFSSWIVSKLSGVFSETLDFVFKLALSFVALFYFLKDGESLKRHALSLSPWSKDRDMVVVSSIETSIKSVVIGSLAIALVQGILIGIGFSITGVPNPTLWGTVGAICALIPGVGTAIVWIPAVLYLFFTGDTTWPWVVQLAWSLLLVSLVDNFLGPMIIQKGVNIHPLLILFSVLGGIQLFGPEGFLLGPLVLSLLFVLIRTLKPEQYVGSPSAGMASPTDAVIENASTSVK